MWSKLVKVGSPVFFVTNNNKPVCHHLTVYKVGRKYFYARGVEGLSAHVDIQVERETGYTASYGTVHESEAVYNQKKNRENLVNRIRGFVGDHLQLKTLNDQQLDGIAAILWPDIQSADVVKNDDLQLALKGLQHFKSFMGGVFPQIGKIACDIYELNEGMMIAEKLLKDVPLLDNSRARLTDWNDDFMAQARREHSSAFNDAVRFGVGFLQIGGEGHES